MLYSVLRLVFGSIFTVFFRWKISGTENIPIQGAAIIASNHISNWDPPVIGTALPRRLRFMAKEELFSIPIFDKIISSLGAFPVKRGSADRTAIKTAISILENGEILGLFPEGTRSKNGQLGKPEPGIALIAVKTGAPIIPAAIIGTNKIFSNGNLFPKFEVIFGKPILIDKGRVDKEGLDRIGVQIMDEISHLLARHNAQ